MRWTTTSSRARRRRNPVRLGFSDGDFAGGGSDALADALVAAGDEEAIRARVQAHLEAGATQVAIQPLEEDDSFGRETLRRLAPVLRA
jgi:hypothetical protein